MDVGKRKQFMSFAWREKASLGLVTFIFGGSHLRLGEHSGAATEWKGKDSEEASEWGDKGKQSEPQSGKINCQW